MANDPAEVTGTNLANERQDPSDRAPVVVPAQNGLRANSGGRLGQLSPASRLSQTSGIWYGIIPPGTTSNVAISGDHFIYLVGNRPLYFRQSGGGDWCTYVPGTGCRNRDGRSFVTLEIKNPDVDPVAAIVFSGFDDLVSPNAFSDLGLVDIIVGSWPPTSTGNTTLPDLSGTLITSNNHGGKWIAFRRKCAVIQQYADGSGNEDLVLICPSGLVLADSAASTGAGPLLRVDDVSGPLQTTSDGNITTNIAIYEIYEALPEFVTRPG